MSAIYQRRSIRKFQSKPVEREKLVEIVRAGCYAPSARNQQPWEFVVITDREQLDKIPQFHGSCGFIKDATAAVVVLGDLKRNDEFWFEDCAAATQNVMLRASELGLGTCWCAVHPRENLQQGFTDLLGLPGHIRPFALIVVGYPDEVKDMPEREVETRIHWEKW